MTRYRVAPSRRSLVGSRGVLAFILGAGFLLHAAAWAQGEVTLREYPLPRDVGPHDVAPARDGGVWFTAQRQGALGHLDPRTGKVALIPLGPNSAPHGVIVDGEGAAWVTDGGADAILRVDAKTLAIRRFALPERNKDADLNTAAFDAAGILWFTGQAGIYGRLDPRAGQLQVCRRRAGRVPTALPPHLPASSTPRSPAIISAASTLRVPPSPR